MTSPEKNAAEEAQTDAADDRPLIPPDEEETESEKNTYDDSSVSARFLVLVGLMWIGKDGGLLDFRNPDTVVVASVYAAALITAAVAILHSAAQARRAVTGALGDTSHTEPTNPLIGNTDGVVTGPPGDATWHRPLAFTDPWYQVPALYCAILGVGRFVLDLIAEPPATKAEIWFLAFLCLGFLVATIGALGAGQDNAVEGRAKRDDTRSPAPADFSPSRVLQDPWFAFLGFAVAFLHFARSGLEELADPDSRRAQFWFWMPFGFLIVTLVIWIVKRVRKERAVDRPAAMGG